MGHSKASGSLSLIPFDVNDIVSVLKSTSAPLMEIDILRALTGMTRMPEGRDKLFELHFSLYHALYRLKYRVSNEGLYLHLDPMRIRLIRIPEDGTCHYYYSESGSFCSATADDGYHCGPHRDPAILHTVSFDPLHDFYTNAENISFGTDGLLEKLMNGIIVYALRRGEIERALTFFGLARPNMKNIKTKYHELAKLFHPDRNGGDDSRMKELNHSYQVLMEVYVL